MLTPSVAFCSLQLHAVGSKPANNLARALPQGVDASILALGCGDVKNILFTAYSEQGFLRNIIFFSFLIDGLKTDEQLDKLWDVYYHFYVDEKIVAFLAAQVSKLKTASATLETWRASAYGKHLRFCDRATFKDFQTGLAKCSKAISDKNRESYASEFAAAIEQAVAGRASHYGDETMIVKGFRSVAPIASPLEDVSREFYQYWNTGTTAFARCTIPNPTFVASLSGVPILHYDSDPTLAYHLATGYINLTDDSPLKPAHNAHGRSQAIKAARSEFRAVARAFQAMRDKITIRFATAEALAFCHTLQNCASSGRSALTANFYRRQFDAQRLELDAAEYGDEKSAPVLFDVIDTSSLADHFGTLNVLVATMPLLSKASFATLHTEPLIEPSDSEENTFDSLLCGHTPTIALLLGVTPVEYYTNIRTTSGFDETVHTIFSEPPFKQESDRSSIQQRTFLSWKLAHHFSGHTGGQKKITIAPDQFIALLSSVVKEMFSNEDINDMIQFMVKSRYPGQKPSTPCYHRGSLAAFVRIVKDRVNTDWAKVGSSLAQTISTNTAIMKDGHSVPGSEYSLGSNYIHDFAGHLDMFDVYTESWLSQSLVAPPGIGGVHAWPTTPKLLAVTFVVPRANIWDLNAYGRTYGNSAILSMAITGSENDPKARYSHNFDNLQLLFGTVSTKGSRDSPDFKVEVVEDRWGWCGKSPLIVCFYIPAATLAKVGPDDTVALEIQSNTQSKMLYRSKQKPLHKTRFGDESGVFVTEFLPGHDGYMRVCPPAPDIAVDSPSASKDGPADLSVTIDKATGQVSTVSRRVHINSAEGKRLLQVQNAEVSVEASLSPFVLNVVLGDKDLVVPVHFTVAVDSTTAHVRIARKSSWIEVSARMAVPAKSACLRDLVYPVMIDQTPAHKGLLVTLSVPHINLDTLPIVDTSKKDRLQWVETMARQMYSRRERYKHNTDKFSPLFSGPSLNTRTDIKDSLLLIFMVASGLDDTPCVSFAVHHPVHGGIQLLIVVSGFRLDLASGTFVVDAAVVPIMRDIAENAGLQSFIGSCRGLGMYPITVNDAGLVMWKKLLPALAERCRTWSHKPGCEYVAASSATISPSLDNGEPGICTCGRGKLPDKFVTVPHWKKVQSYATRIAISPLTYAEFVEDEIDYTDPMRGGNMKGNFRQTGTATAQAGLAHRPAAKQTSQEGVEPAAADPFALAACKRCGKADSPGSPLKTCSRCRAVKYCSAACQKQDWKTHKRVCMPMLV